MEMGLTRWLQLSNVEELLFTSNMGAAEVKQHLDAVVTSDLNDCDAKFNMLNGLIGYRSPQ